MFDADIIVLEFFGFVLGSNEQLIEALGDIKPLACHCIAGDARNAIQRLLKFFFHQIGRHAGLFQKARYETLFLFQQSQGEMFDIYGLMLVTCANGLRLRQRGL